MELYIMVNLNFNVNDCNRQFVKELQNKSILKEEWELVDKLLLGRLSIAGISRVTGISEVWLQDYINKKYKDTKLKQVVKKRDQGKYEEAEDYFKKSLVISEKVLGFEHPDTATTYNNLATLYFHQKKYKNSALYFDKALKITEKVLGSDHPTTKTMKSNLEILKQNM